MKYTILYNNVSLIINAREILTAKYEIIIQRLYYVMHITLINKGFRLFKFFLINDIFDNSLNKYRFYILTLFS